ncbi:hypothetical protein IPF37_05540 [bacterium]|nr:MAG: hypothetical protein IPF37_05540 [bacterium]
MKAIRFLLFMLSFLSMPICSTYALKDPGFGDFSIVWGLDRGNGARVSVTEKLLYQQHENSWDVVLGEPLKHLAVNAALEVFGLTVQGHLVKRTGITAGCVQGQAWKQVPTPFTFDSIALGSNKQMWGIRFDGKPVFNDGADWSLISEDIFVDIAVGSRYAVWALDSHGVCFVRQDVTDKNLQGTAWLPVSCPEQVAHVAVGTDQNVWAVSHDGNVYIRRGIRPALIQGTDWEKVGNKALMTVAVGHDGQVWGIADDYRIFQRVGITSTNSIGVGWRKIPGKMQKLAATMYPGIQPGGRTYTHFGPDRDDEAIFNEAWRLKEPGKGWVQFKARSKADLFLRFSSVPYHKKDETIHVSLGSKKNKRALITKLGGVEQSLKVCDHDGGLLGPETAWNDYWVSVENGVLRLGKSAQRGDNELISFEDAALRNVCYVAFGGGKKHVHEFSQIQTDERPLVTKNINLASGFSIIPGNAARLAIGRCGTKNLIFSLGSDGCLYQYSPSILQHAWEKLSQKMVSGEEIVRFKDIAVSSDNQLWALNDHGNALHYHSERAAWECFDSQIKLDRLVVGNKNSIWGLNKKTQAVYRYTQNGWRQEALDGIMALDAGFDGAVVALNTAQEAFSFNWENELWEKLAHIQGFGRIAVAHQNLMIGSRAVGNDYFCWVRKNNHWLRLTADNKTGACGFKQVAINDVGAMVALDDYGTIYKKDKE